MAVHSVCLNLSCICKVGCGLRDSYTCSINLMQRRHIAHNVLYCLSRRWSGSLSLQQLFWSMNDVNVCTAVLKRQLEEMDRSRVCCLSCVPFLYGQMRNMWLAMESKCSGCLMIILLIVLGQLGLQGLLDQLLFKIRYGLCFVTFHNYIIFYLKWAKSALRVWHEVWVVDWSL